MKLLSIGMALVFTLGCGDKGAEPAAPTSRRAAAVKAEKSAGPINDQAGFCEKAYPKSGPEARPFTWPPQRPLPGKEVAEVTQATGGWTYLNVWATWCAPCLAEMGLLGRWSQAINQEGSPLALELLTIEDESSVLVPKLRQSRTIASFNNATGACTVAALDFTPAIGDKAWVTSRAQTGP